MGTRDELIREFYRAVSTPGFAGPRARAAYQCLLRLGEACGHRSENPYDVAKAGMREVASEGTDHAATALAMYAILDGGIAFSEYAAWLLSEMGTPAALAGLDEMVKKLRGETWVDEIMHYRDVARGEG